MGRHELSLVLDTHVLIWWITNSDQLSKTQIAALERADARGEPLGVSAISFWETAKLVERGKLELQVPLDELFDDLEDHPSIRVLPMTPRIALESTRLGAGFPSDPADQIIAATARVHGLRLITADARIRKSRVVGVI